MLSPTFVLWDIGYNLYTYSSILIIILILCQVKRNYHRITLESKRSGYQHYRKVRKKTRNEASTARGDSGKKPDMPKKLLSVIKSQGWLPQEGSVRRLLCTDPRCDICNDVALDIHQLLTGKHTPISKNALIPSKFSTYQEIMSGSTVTFEPKQESHFLLHSNEPTLSSAVPVVSHVKHQSSFTQLCAQSPSAVSTYDYWAEHDQLRQEFQFTEMSPDHETNFCLLPEDQNVPESQQTMMQRSSNFLCGFQGLNSSVSVLTMSQDVTADTLTHPLSLHIVAVHPAYPLNLSPESLRLLEMHVKKWMHFQRWGLPRRVEESMRQIMPCSPLFYQPENNQPVCFIHNNPLNLTIERFGTMSYQTWGSFMAGQPTQIFWVSEWSMVIDPEQRYTYQQIQNHLTLVLPSPAFKDFDGLNTLPGQQINDPVSHLQQKYRQLFCGLPSLHSESLLGAWGTQGFSLNGTMSKLSMKDPFLFQELSFLPPLPKILPQLTQLPSQSFSNEVTSADHPQAEINVPFLTLAECEALEWHMIQKQLQVQWGLPAIFQGSQPALSPMHCRSYDKAQSSGIVKTSWSGKHTSVLRRKFFPLENSRRSLNVHLQRQLSHHCWGLSEKTQKSSQHVLAHNNQQLLSLRSTRVDSNVGTFQPADQEATLVDESFTKLMDTELVYMPFLCAQAKAMLQNHIHTKCGQILQGNIPACVYSSQECMIPGGQQVTPFTCIPESKTLELQASAGPDSKDKVMPWMPMTLDQQQQNPSIIDTEHPKLSENLTKEVIEKLEVTLRHKYMTFLSGLPDLYYVALSRAVSPENTTQAITTNMVDKPVERLAEPVAPMLPLEEQCLSPAPCLQDTGNTCTDSPHQFQDEVQNKVVAEPVTLESQSEPPWYISFSKTKWSKLNFHLKKKILEVHLGIPIKARKSRELMLPISKKITTQGSLESLNKQEKVLPKDLSNPPNSPCDPDLEQFYHKKQLGIELKAMQKNQKQPLSYTVSHDSGQWVSKIPQPTSDMTAAQVLCVQLEKNLNTPNLDEAWDQEPHSSSKKKDSAQIPTLTEKREDLGRHKNVGNQGEGDAGFVLASIKGSLLAEGQCQKGTLLNKTLYSHQHGSHQHSRQTMQNASHQPSRQDCPQLMLLKQTLGTHNENKGEKSSLRGSQAKISVIHKPARIPQYAQSARFQMSQEQSFLGQPALRKPLQGQRLQHRLLQGQRMPVPAHKSSSLPESGLRNKMKFFLHCISPKIKDKRHHKPMLSITEKVIRKELVQKNLAPVKSPMEQTKREKTSENPMTLCTPTKKQVVVPSLPGPQFSENKLRHRSCSHQQHSESVLGPPRHCPRHCPRMAFVTHLRNPP
ncbi:protein FAM205A-like [Suncus etruscus]|uniref:protein FAM205A-like n=1 Tax=Suncus etruscus TaxID=109475 RepID=UPI00210FFBE6|nr:protein FAM205A-like [Suncus etruscus]